MAVIDELFYLPAIPKQYFQTFKPRTTPLAPKVIPANTNGFQIIGEGILKQRGIIRDVSITVNNPDLEFVIAFDGRDYPVTLSALKEGNDIGYQGSFPYITIYDTANNYYGLAWNAQRLFNDNAVVYANNKTTSEIQILEFVMEAYTFAPGFYSALARVKNGEELIEEYINPKVQVNKA